MYRLAARGDVTRFKHYQFRIINAYQTVSLLKATYVIIPAEYRNNTLIGMTFQGHEPSHINQQYIFAPIV
jgi:hypothetical protein